MQRHVVLAIVAAGVGGILGLLCSTVVLVNSGLSLVPWALAGLAVGAVSGSRRDALVRGGVYGFALAYVFMIAGYDGAEPLRTRLLPFLALGVVGSVCGAVLAVIGFAVRRAIRRGPHEGRGGRVAPDSLGR
jgi:hypothetical protein